MGLYLNGKIVSSNTDFSDKDNVAPILLSSTDGQRIYKRTVLFLLYAAFNKLFPEYTLECSHSIYRGEYVRVFPQKIDQRKLNTARKLMNQWIEQDLPIQRLVANEKNTQIANMQSEELSSTNGHFYIYQLNDYVDRSIDVLAPSCGYVKTFNLMLEDEGIVLLIPKKKNLSEIETPKKHVLLANTFKTMEEWASIHGIYYLGDLNNKMMNNDYEDTIKICETLQENMFSLAASNAIEKKAKIIFLNGPSSSGKTTSAHRLRIQLMVQKMFPMVISMDDYFKARDKMEKEPDGSVDFESIKCVDLEEFHDQIIKLTNGEPVNMRRFNFVTGEAEYDSDPTSLPSNGILIIEGIHAFNPLVLDLFKDVSYYKVAVNPLTWINIDHHNRLLSSDVRKIRRIVRDIRTRGSSAERTINMWASVREGEENNIFPFLETCDMMINTTLAYELSALKKQATKALESVDKNSNCMPEVNRLLNILAKVKSLPSDKDIPQNSILREFIG